MEFCMNKICMMIKFECIKRENNRIGLPARSKDLVNIQSKLSSMNIGERDEAIWVILRKGTYTSAETCKLKINWFPLAIPKQAFVLWLAVHNSLITGERMLKWG